MKKLTVLFLLSSTTIVCAQQQKSPSALERVSLSLGQCVGQLEQKADDHSMIQKNLIEAYTRIKELEDKLKTYEKKE